MRQIQYMRASSRMHGLALRSAWLSLVFPVSQEPHGGAVYLRVPLAFERTGMTGTRNRLRDQVVYESQQRLVIGFAAC
jgi:hypothetical protein